METLSADQLSAEALGADPRVTPTIAGGEARAPLPPPSPDAAQEGERDAAGEAFDPSKHEPRRAADGRWRRKRGNGARLAAGRPLAGLRSKVVLPPPPAPTPYRSPMGEDTAEPAGPGVPVVQAELAPGLPLEDYAATGASLASLLWLVLRAALGPAWDPKEGERERYAEAFQRTWHTYQLPRLGGWLELVGLGAQSATARAGDAETRGRVARFARWLGWKPKDTRDAQPGGRDHGEREVGPRP